MGGRGSASAKANGNSKSGVGVSTSKVSEAKAGKAGGGGEGETLTMSKIKKELGGRDINLDAPKLKRMMDSAKVGTSFEFHNNPYNPDVKDTYTKTGPKKWTLTHSYINKSGNEESWSGKATEDDLWNAIFAG